MIDFTFNMILFKLFLFLSLKGFSNVNFGVLADPNGTIRVQLWRAQGDLNQEVISEFEDRAHITDEIWMRDNRTIDFMIFDAEAERMASLLDKNNVSRKILIEDVREKVDDALVHTFPTRRNGNMVRTSRGSMDWTKYPTLDHIYAYLETINKKYSHCNLITLGKTLNNKPIYVLKISTMNPTNKAILIDSGIHGCEWTSVVSTLYFIDSIVHSFYKQPSYIKDRDWHIIPVLNPDGYEYSLHNDRLWKKNRRKVSEFCYGVDLNRNFEYNWAKQDSTRSICSETFCGRAPFSEAETQAFKRLTDGPRFHGYLSIHSAGTKVLFPMGVTRSDHADQIVMTKAMAEAMRSLQNYQYISGDIHALRKIGYGMAIDWMYFTKKITHSYILETRGQNGLDVLGPKEILPAAKEIHLGITKFAELFNS
ncbi:zinc carboxypeptidase-like [Spodoptera frugiperda]|uniref:Zinc carboxypeptidase-like n=1 Tax=Spodoptera frugiperda TaxID=7108 RepID=A0A9R0DRE0_SPOFR|nr:zinc carboxypeptidase-like [Spodoptera frugiperda]